MRKILNNIRWLFSYMSSILMYASMVVLVLIGILLVAYYIDGTKRMSNLEKPLYSAYVIATGSMEPVIKTKDAVLVRRVESDDIKVGDVVTYLSNDEAYPGILITHRVVNIDDENGRKLYYTKGDYNDTIDRLPIDDSQIYGKVIMRIPKIGYIKYFLVSSSGWMIAIAIPSLIIIICNVMRKLKKSKEDEPLMKVSNKKVIDFAE